MSFVVYASVIFVEYENLYNQTSPLGPHLWTILFHSHQGFLGRSRGRLPLLSEPGPKLASGVRAGAGAKIIVNSDPGTVARICERSEPEPAAPELIIPSLNMIRKGFLD